MKQYLFYLNFKVKILSVATTFHSKLLKALHDCKPNPNNRDCALKWLQLMGETVACLVENTMSSTSDDR